MSKMALISCMAMLVFVAGCGDEDRQDSPTDEEYRRVSSQVQEVMETYRQAVWTEVLPKLEEMDGNKASEFIEQEIARLANQYLVPHKELLAKGAKHLLEGLPKADPINRSKWEPMYPDMKKENFMLFDSSEDIGQGVAFAALWNPVVATDCYRRMVQTKVMDKASYSKRAMLNGFVPSKQTVVDADPDHPILAVKTGNEFWIISLLRADDGIYELKKIEWLKRKAENGK